MLENVESRLYRPYIYYTSVVCHEGCAFYTVLYHIYDIYIYVYVFPLMGKTVAMETSCSILVDEPPNDPAAVIINLVTTSTAYKLISGTCWPSPCHQPYIVPSPGCVRFFYVVHPIVKVMLASTSPEI